MTKPFDYSENSPYRPGHIASKTKKVDGGFEAVATFFFNGKKINEKRFIAPTRNRAEKGAMELVSGKA